MYTKAGNVALKQSQNHGALSCVKCLIARSCNSYSAAKKRCFYDVLGVDQNADKKEIKNAYVTKTKELHPDKNINDPDLHDLFVEVNEAYTVLGNEAKRTEYDNSKLTMTRIRYTAGNASTHTPFGSMSVERDFSPKFQGFNEDGQYTSNMFREFEFAKEKYRGERKSANKYIIFTVLALMAAGSGFHYFQINFLYKRFEEYQDKIHLESTNVYESVREKAKMNGARKQLQLLASNKDIPDTSTT